MSKRTDIRPLGVARGYEEVDFYLQITGCPSCGGRDIGDPRVITGKLLDDGPPARRGSYQFVTCPSCAAQRAVRFFHGEGMKDPPRAFELGGATPSTMIAPHLFAKELERAFRELGVDLESLPWLADDAFQAVFDEWSFAKRSQNELRKFIPPGAVRVPDNCFHSLEAKAYLAAHPEQFTLAHLDARGAALAPILEAIRARNVARRESADPGATPTVMPLPLLSHAALASHELWIQNPAQLRAQPMRGKGVDVRGRNFARRVLSRMELENSTLLECGFADAVLEEVRLVHVNVAGSNFSRTNLRGGHFERCDFRGVTLDQVALDGATFVNCVMTGARITGGSSGERVTFTRCDLRGVHWDERDVSRFTFEDSQR